MSDLLVVFLIGLGTPFYWLFWGLTHPIELWRRLRETAEDPSEW